MTDIYAFEVNFLRADFYQEADQLLTSSWSKPLRQVTELENERLFFLWNAKVALVMVETPFS